MTEEERREAERLAREYRYGGLNYGPKIYIDAYAAACEAKRDVDHLEDMERIQNAERALEAERARAEDLDSKLNYEREAVAACESELNAERARSAKLLAAWKAYDENADDLDIMLAYAELKDAFTEYEASRD